MSYEEDLRKVREDWRNLQYVKNQTEAICLAAVKQDGLALEYVENQTPELCMEAVKQCGLALKYVQNQTPELCMEAVKQNGYVLKYVKEQTEAICMEAVKQRGLALEYVKEQTEELCLEAVRQTGLALEYVKEQTEELCMEAVKKNGLALQFVKNQTEAICLEAVRQNGYALEYVKNQTEAVCLEAVKQNGDALQFVKNQTEAICLEAVRQNGCALEYVENQTDEICLAAVEHTIDAIHYVDKQILRQALHLVRKEQEKKASSKMNTTIGDKKVRMVIEFDIDSEALAEHGLKEQDILNSLCIQEHSVTDGFEIFPKHPYLNPSMDFVLCSEATIVSKEFVSEREKEPVLRVPIFDEGYLVAERNPDPDYDGIAVMLETKEKDLIDLALIEHTTEHPDKLSMYLYEDVYDEDFTRKAEIESKDVRKALNYKEKCEEERGI